MWLYFVCSQRRRLYSSAGFYILLPPSLHKRQWHKPTINKSTRNLCPRRVFKNAPSEWTRPFFTGTFLPSLNLQLFVIHLQPRPIYCSNQMLIGWHLLCEMQHVSAHQLNSLNSVYQTSLFISVWVCVCVCNVQIFICGPNSIYSTIFTYAKDDATTQYWVVSWDDERVFA